VLVIRGHPFLYRPPEPLPELPVALVILLLHLREHVSTFFTSPLRICAICRSCCSISRETLSDRSDESTTPLMNLRYRGNRSSHFSRIFTLCAKSCSPLSDPR